MSNVINKRYEILFLYDIKDANPNGDPNDENKPRLDEETGHNIVTDVRLKRTVRDFLYSQGNEIFVREIEDENGSIQDAKQRALDFSNEEKKSMEKLPLAEQKRIIADNVISKCIDVRLFGATIPLELKVSGKDKTSSITYTGPSQFKMGRSLHRTKNFFVKGTGAFASKQGNTQKTFREEYILPYSLIAFHGIVNEGNATKTCLTEEDLTKLKNALWNGTKNLISRSKFGQSPRFLLCVSYKKPGFFIGDLDHLVSLQTELREEEIRRPEEFELDITKLLEAFATYTEYIEKVEFIACERMNFTASGKKIVLSSCQNFTDISKEVI